MIVGTVKIMQGLDFSSPILLHLEGKVMFFFHYPGRFYKFRMYLLLTKQSQPCPWDVHVQTYGEDYESARYRRNFHTEHRQQPSPRGSTNFHMEFMERFTLGLASYYVQERWEWLASWSRRQALVNLTSKPLGKEGKRKLYQFVQVKPRKHNAAGWDDQM